MNSEAIEGFQAKVGRPQVASKIGGCTATPQPESSNFTALANPWPLSSMAHHRPHGESRSHPLNFSQNRSSVAAGRLGKGYHVIQDPRVQGTRGPCTFDIESN